MVRSSGRKRRRRKIFDNSELANSKISTQHNGNTKLIRTRTPKKKKQKQKNTNKNKPTIRAKENKLNKNRTTSSLASDTIPPVIISTSPDDGINNLPTVVSHPVTMHMCACGLLHSDIRVVQNAHHKHDKCCSLHSAAAPPVEIPTFKPTSNKRLRRRKRDNTKHLERSSFLWVQRWIEKNQTWPTTSYPWVQWAQRYHPTSEFIWHIGSTDQNVAARASDYAIRHSCARDNFAEIVQQWWDKHDRHLLPLNNRSFRPVGNAQNTHSPLCVLAIQGIIITKQFASDCVCVCV